MKERVVVIAVLMFLVLSLFPVHGGRTQHSETEFSEPISEQLKEHRVSYVEHSPIFIDEDGDFISLGFPGNGSESNPYLIENLNITTTDRCILVGSTSVYYVISGCYINSTGTADRAVELDTAPNGVVVDSLIFGGADGVSINYCTDMRVENCTITGSDGDGIAVSSSSRVSIIDVDISDCGNGGVRAGFSNNIIIQNCTISDITYAGVDMYSGSYGQVLNCTIFNCGREGLETRLNHTMIMGNEIYNNGLEAASFLGIMIYHAYNTTIYDNDIYDNSYGGIYPMSSDTCNITYNRICNNGAVGIVGYKTPNVTITHNQILNNGWPLDGNGGIDASDSADWTIAYNRITNNTLVGISLSTFNRTLVEHNEVYDNIYANVYARWSEDCNFTSNTIRGAERGLYLAGFDNARVIDNLIYDASYRGMSLSGMSTSWFYMNDIAWNTQQVYQQSNTGLYWDNNETVGIGNWWSDFDGSPTYSVSGGGVDRFPHISLNASEAAPIAFETSSTGNIMNWTQASAHNPSHYEVYVDGVLFQNSTWDGFYVEVNVDSLEFGYHEMNLTVYHITGHSASSISYANVTDTTSPTWDVVPTDQVAEYGNHFMYNVSASDLRGIVHYTLNDTSYFSISDEGSISNTSLVPVGIHRLEVRAYDPSSLSCVGSITISVSDTTSPTWNMTIEPQVLEYGESLAYQLLANDLSDIGAWYVNDAVNFSIVNGLLLNLGTLEPGIYHLEITVEDIHGNSLTVFVTVTVGDPPTPTTTSTTPPTTTTPTSSTTTPPDGGPDMTLLIVGGIGAAIVIIIVVVVISKKKG